MGLLDGKVAIVTGAGGGIGKATAELFSREGARVVINDRGCDSDGSGSDPARAAQVAKDIVAAGGQAVPSGDDVADPAGATRIIETALSEFGRLDILVNNAGILRDKTLLKTEPEMWDSVLAVHLTGTYLCTQAAARALREQGEGGSIINTTSVSGLRGNFGQTNTSAAKAGVYGLTRTASIELQRHDIRVNAVAPIAKTRLTEHLPMFQKVDSMRPEHVAPGHLFLASDLSRDISGEVLSIAGGKISVFRLVESAGRLKESGDGIWTAEEIAENWEAVSKL